MKQLLLFILFLLLGLGVQAQVGHISYLEGRVVVNSSPGQIEPKQFTAKINDPVFDYQIIKTHDRSLADILWTDGSRSSVESGSSYAIKELWEGRKPVDNGLFAGFKKVFTTAKASAKPEEGGIRRSRVTADSLPKPDQLYWKEDPEMSFETASALYEGRDYVHAASAFKMFINQKPMDSRCKYALFALGHCYAVMGNTGKARKIFEQFVTQYVGDDLQSDAELILNRL